MRKSWRFPDVTATILMVAVLCAIWFAFAPIQLGGQTSIVIVNGKSMEPGFHKGDLVVGRQAVNYQVGDVVTYHDAGMKANVIHRIIGIEGDRYILQGDNNTWVDAYQPTRDEMVGKLWLHVPKLGVAVEWVRRPLNLALAAGFIATLMMMDLMMQNQKPKHNGKKKKQAGENPVGIFETALYLFGFLALVFLALAIFAFSQPVLRAADDISYQQTGEFSYTAVGTPELNDTGSVRSGEPIFTNITCQLDLGFTFALQGEKLGKIAGFHQLFAMVTDQKSGLKRTFPLTPSTYFTGSTYTNHATLDLCQLQTLMASVEQKTGFHLNSYTLAIVSQVMAGGKIAGQDFIDTFEPKLTMNFDQLHFYLTDDSAKPNGLRTVQPETLGSQGKVKNTFKLLGLILPVEETQLAAIVGLILSFNGLMVVGAAFFMAARRNPEMINHIKFGSILMEVSSRALQTFSPATDVPVIDDLAKLAERHSAMIMHLARGDAHYYFVQIEGATYRCITSKAEAVNPGSGLVGWMKNLRAFSAPRE